MTARDTDLTAAIARVVEARRGETLRLLQDFVRVPA
jgi:hypothetical protein